jgi:hypothetical protein
VFDNDVKSSLNRAKHRVIPLSRLKNRPAAGAGGEDTRTIPIPPDLIRLLRVRIRRYGTTPDGPGVPSAQRDAALNRTPVAPHILARVKAALERLDDHRGRAGDAG